MLCHRDHSSISFRGRVGEVAYTLYYSCLWLGCKNLASAIYHFILIWASGTVFNYICKPRSMALGLIILANLHFMPILYTIAASGSGVKTLQALYTISSSFRPLARYLIILASPGQWRWDLNILEHLQFMYIQLVCFHHGVLSRCRFSCLKRAYRN